MRANAPTVASHAVCPSVALNSAVGMNVAPSLPITFTEVANASPAFGSSSPVVPATVNSALTFWLDSAANVAPHVGSSA